MWNAKKQVQVNFIKVPGIVVLCIASPAVLLAVILPIAALFLGPGVGIDVPFPAKVGLVFVFSHPWFSLVLGSKLCHFEHPGRWLLREGL
jgi:hypothetical protein